MAAFAKWLKKWCFQKPTDEAYDLAKVAWAKATELEREACAKICEAQAKEPECTERAQYCADAIRMRSN